jgi:hypothetical protein
MMNLEQFKTQQATGLMAWEVANEYPDLSQEEQLKIFNERCETEYWLYLRDHV